MRAVVLGAAAGGGFPQWNSNSPGCNRARRGDPSAPSRTQASVAVSADGDRWVILSASPDIRRQIEATPQLHPRTGLRSSPIAAVILTGGDVDAISGLLTLRERQPFTVYATSRVHAVLDGNPIFEVLNREIVMRETVPLGVQIDTKAGVAFELFAVPGKTPLYLEGEGAPAIEENEQTAGVRITGGGATLFYIPGCAAMTPALADRLRGADAVMFDGTLYADDEMIRAGLGPKTGLRMGHMSVSGPGGAIAAFSGLEVRRRIFIHINCSNPILLADSPERAQTENAGWEVAYDGMEIAL